MPQSLSNVLLHIVFSTKGRRPWIDPAVEDDLHEYLGGICNDLGCQPHRIGGVPDHVHLACSLSRTVAIAALVQEIKQGSSHWIKSRGDAYRDFAWQNGYAAFSVGQSQLDDLCRYIHRQRQHHERIGFADELQTLLEKYRVEYDPRYLLD